MPAEAGDVGKSNNVEIISVGVKNGAVIGKGNLVTFDGNGFAIQGTASENPAVTGRGIALEAKTGITSDGTIKIRIAIRGDVYATAGGAIKPNARLQGTASGKLLTATLAVASQVEHNKWISATYIGKEGEERGNATDAADTNVILVKLD
jgi:hypothetical protein